MSGAGEGEVADAELRKGDGAWEGDKPSGQEISTCCEQVGGGLHRGVGHTGAADAVAGWHASDRHPLPPPPGGEDASSSGLCSADHCGPDENAAAQAVQRDDGGERIGGAGRSGEKPPLQPVGSRPRHTDKQEHNYNMARPPNRHNQNPCPPNHKSYDGRPTSGVSRSLGISLFSPTFLPCLPAYIVLPLSC